MQSTNFLDIPRMAIFIRCYFSRVGDILCKLFFFFLFFFFFVKKNKKGRGQHLPFCPPESAIQKNQACYLKSRNSSSCR